MRPSGESNHPKKPAWAAQIVMLLLAALFLWLMGTGILYVARFVISKLGNI